MVSCPHTASKELASTSSVYAVEPDPIPPPALTIDLAEAREWLEMCYRETRPEERGFDDRGLEQRWADIAAEVAATGTYTHTTHELNWGTRVAWRQSVRCVGRARWQSLVVRDARSATSTAEVAAELDAHLRTATNGGRIRSTITVFAPDGAGGPRVRIANEQLIRYAGYRQPDGTVLGDPRYVAFTEMLIREGWCPPAPQSAFDVLPWFITTETEPFRVVPIPRDAVFEVPITHPDPELDWFADLGLHWHAVPVISHMRLRIGGVNYSCAPFNGWYLVDEVATRNFGDPDRYNQLPLIAALMGLDTSSTANFWQLRAAVELNTAVLHSFRAAGVRIEEPVAESDLFAEFVRREEAAGRPAYADWSWINGHIGATFGQAWHRYYAAGEPNPNYWLDDSARDLAAGCPVQHDDAQSVPGARHHRAEFPAAPEPARSERVL